MSIQLKAPHAPAVFVTRNALEARAFEAMALPALNPNHPNQSIAAPKIESAIEDGGIASLLNPLLAPTIKANTNPAIPEHVSTTKPPAKSAMPILSSQPPPQTQWARGTYTIVDQMMLKMTQELNFTLSTTEPLIKAVVIAANVS